MSQTKFFAFQKVKRHQRRLELCTTCLINGLHLTERTAAVPSRDRQDLFSQAGEDRRSS